MIAQQYLKLVSCAVRPPIPVLHIIKSLGRGGAEMLLPESLDKHDKLKFSFHYLYFLPWKNQLVGQLKQAGGTVICFPAKNNLGILLSVRKIITYVKMHSIQLIHCHLPWAGIVGRLVGRITGIPVVYTEHNKWERYHKLTYCLNKFSYSSQQRVIAVSAEVAKSIAAHYHKKEPVVQVILNGTDTDKFSARHQNDKDIRTALGISANTIVIGTACVFRVQKRLTIWLEVACAIHQKYPDTYFIVVGDGVLHDTVHEKAKQLGMGEYLCFAGLQTKVRPWLKAMDIFMMSSEFEGLPVALLEAMSMGCMPVCTAAGGIPEIIEDGVNGMLVPVGAPHQLADKLITFLGQPQRLAAIQQAARKTVVTNFSMQLMVQQLEAMYDSVLLKK